jgi:UDP-N-acetyl-D-glucosamine dehydrogenase
MEILDKIRERKARTGVIGLGYVGLPLAIEFAHAGFHAVGIDVDKRKVDAINAGQSYIVDTSNEEVASLVATGRLQATTDFTAIEDLDTINICVPTPLRKTKDPDMTYVVAAVSEIKKHLRAGQLIILESTTYPGTTEELVLRAAELYTWRPLRSRLQRPLGTESLRRWFGLPTKDQPIGCGLLAQKRRLL